MIENDYIQKIRYVHLVTEGMRNGNTFLLKKKEVIFFQSDCSGISSKEKR